MRRTTLIGLGVGALGAAGLLLYPGCSSRPAATTTGTGGRGTTSSGAGNGGHGGAGTGGVAPMPGESVLQHHNSPTRDGLYVQPVLTRMAAKGLHLDTSFHAQTQGATYAQPLYVDGGKGGKDVVLVATEQNWVYALDAATGATVWKRQVGAPVPLGKMGCGNIDPFGVTGTPVIDFPSRTMYLDALVDDGGPTHRIFAVSLDDGSLKAGWPVDMSTVKAGATTFKAQFHGQRGALAIVGGTLYVPFGGLFGDCGDYHGWLVAVPLASPAGVQAWATEARGGGAWAPGGVSSDGTSVFIATGNTFSATTWAGGEAILRFGTGDAFGAKPADYFAPLNWQALDAGDADLGGTAPVLFDMPGSVPSKLTAAMGKDGRVRLLDREHLGGVSTPLADQKISDAELINAPAAYTTAQGTYLAFRGAGNICLNAFGGDLAAVKLTPGSPPAFGKGWCAHQNGMGSPMVTTTDGHAEAIVWGLGAEGDGRLHGINGDTGDVVFDGGGPGDVMAGLRRFSTPIAAKGRIFVAGDGTVYAFTP